MEDSGDKRVDKDVDIGDEDLVVDAFAPTFSREKRKRAIISSELAPERRREGGEAAGDLGGDVAAGGDGQQGGGEEREDGSEHENGVGHEDDDDEVIITGESVDEAVAAQHKEREKEGTREEPAALPLTREKLDKIRALGGQKFWKVSVRTYVYTNGWGTDLSQVKSHSSSPCTRPFCRWASPFPPRRQRPRLIE
jgi:hypothetical protein